jgi:glycosyltransferase involved in cell wall biosynthesis
MTKKSKIIDQPTCNDYHSRDGVLHQKGKHPKVSIGMPVYNGGSSIQQAIESILTQTFTDFELIISDNASTDDTEAICRLYEKRDARIRYVRHEKNRGSSANFQFVLDEAVGEYFMWAAADDVRSDSFLALNVKFLEDNIDFVASTSPVRTDSSDFNEIKFGDFTLDEQDSNQRIIRFFTGWHANGRFYSLIRREILTQSRYNVKDYLGSDWSLVLFLLHKGKINRADGGWVILGTSGVSRTTNIFKKYNSSIISFMVPFYELASFSFCLSKSMPISLKIMLFLKLCRLNLSALRLNLKWKIFGFPK